MTENDKIKIEIAAAIAGSVGLAYYVKVVRPKMKFKKWKRSRIQLVNNVKNGLVYDAGEPDFTPEAWNDKFEFDTKFVDIAMNIRDL